MPADSRLNTQIVEMDEQECLAMLATKDLGRLGVVVHGEPEIFPVNYALDAAGSVVFRTSDGTKLAAALNRPVVFEVDDTDPATRQGWSVVVHGVAHHTEHIAAGDRRLDSWVADRSYLIRITRKSIDGRRL